MSSNGVSVSIMDRKSSTSLSNIGGTVYGIITVTVSFSTKAPSGHIIGI